MLVFDFYNVLTSNGGGASDVGLASGNHHRVWNGAVQHKTDDGADLLAYPSAGDSHPSAAGDQKATAEFVPLLNAAYNAWKGNGGGALPALAIDDVTVDRGQQRHARTPCSPSASRPPTRWPSASSYATANGTATAGSDYTAASGTLTFAAGVTSQTVSVPVTGDAPLRGRRELHRRPLRRRQRDHRRRAAASAPSPTTTRCRPSRSTTSPSPRATAAPRRRLHRQPLGRQRPAGRPSAYATANGTAIAGSDYTAVSGSLTFAPGETTKTVTVAVLGDTVAEADETFVVNLSGAGGATIADARASAPSPTTTRYRRSRSTTSPSPRATAARTNAVFTVSLSAASGLAVTVDYATANGTATRRHRLHRRLRHPDASRPARPRTVSVAVLGDALVEADESFTVSLSGASGATIADGQGAATIRNDDTVGPRTFAPHPASVRKGGRATLIYRVTDNVAASAAVTIRVRTRAGALKKTLTLGLRGTGPERRARFTCTLKRGVYRFTVEARDLSGNMSTGWQVGCITNTSAPRTFSWICTYASPSLKRVTRAWPRVRPRKVQTSSQSASLAVPQKTLHRPRPGHAAAGASAVSRP